MTTAITTAEVQQAASELARMRGALASWLKYRTINDRVLAGTAQVRKPMPYAQRVVASRRDVAVEQDLANKLSALLGAIMPGQMLPSSDLSSNPQGAVELAQIALTGGAAGPAATGGFATPGWLSWPVLIVGGLLLVALTAIKSAADVAKDQEEKACIEVGACTDYGFWLKAGGVAVLAWLAWEKLGIKHTFTRKGGS